MVRSDIPRRQSELNLLRISIQELSHIHNLRRCDGTQFPGTSAPPPAGTRKVICPAFFPPSPIILTQFPSLIVPQPYLNRPGQRPMPPPPQHFPCGSDCPPGEPVGLRQRGRRPPPRPTSRRWWWRWRRRTSRPTPPPRAPLPPGPVHWGGGGTTDSGGGVPLQQSGDQFSKQMG